MVEYKVKNMISPLPLGNSVINGSIAEQMGIFFENRITSDYAKNVIYQETEDAFRTKFDDSTPIGWWQGEYWGKWIIGACRVCRYSHDESLKEFIRKASHTLITFQRDDGYIGTYKNSENMLLADPEKVFEYYGFKSQWNWNVWCRKYTLWGLLEAYMLIGDKEILDAAKGHASHLIGELRRLGYHLCDVGTFKGLPAGSILKPMLILYRITEDEKYLDFCLEEAKMWEREDNSIPNIISNCLKNIPIHEWYPDSYEWAKTYEMMSCFDGLCELYRVTGNEKYLKTVVNAHDLIKKYEYNDVFGVSCNDVFYNASNYMNSITEPCDTIHWMRMCYELFCLTGKPEYMDDIEESFYNPFLASSYADGKWGARGVRSSGRHMTAHGQAHMKYSHCCVNNMPRGYMNFIESMVMKSEDKIYINMYTEYNGCIDDTKIDINGTYLRDGKVTIKISGGKAEKLCLRIPYWSEKTSVIIDGNRFCPTCGKYFECEIAMGTKTIEIEFDMTPRICDSKAEIVHPKETDYATRRFGGGAASIYSAMYQGRRSTLHYGPLLLTRSKKCGNTEDEMFGDSIACEKTVCGKGYTAAVTPIEADKTRVKFKVHFDNGTDSFDTVMCDYATGSNEESAEDNHLFSIWI